MTSRLCSVLPLAALLLAGCAGVRPQAAFDDVRQTVAERAPDYRVAWITGAPEDAEAEAAVAALLADSLTADAAVQVALLNNRHLQATYEDLGVAQAALVQAGLLSNPIFGARALWPLEDGDAPDFGFTAAIGFLDVFYLPLRRRVAQSDYEAARLRVAEAVLDLAARTRTAYVEAQAAEARLALQRRVVQNAEAAYEAARLLREAGNVPAVDLLAEQARYERARLDLVVEEAEAIARREALVRLMGVFGDQTAFRLAVDLPPVPAELPVVDVAALEREAVEASLALDAARQDVEAYARRLGLATPESLLPDLDLGTEAERDDGEWKLGPEVEVALPLFDQGQARRAAARAELRRRQSLYYATAVDVRSAARVLAVRLAAAHRAALHAQQVVLPLHAELTQRTLLQYNAMQTGVFGLLQAQQQEAEAARRTIDAIAAYWAARADLDALLQGRMPSLNGSASPTPTSSPAPREAGH